MSNAEESSYYEIALTNRQVMVAFVILLVCVLGAFFGGVWVGKGQPVVAAADEKATGPSEVVALSEGREEPAEFEFFNRDGAQPTPAQRPDLERIATQPNPDTTLAQDLGVEPADQPTEDVKDEPPVAIADQTVAVEPPVAADPSPPAAGGGAATGITEAPDGPVVIQVFSSRDEIQARRLLTRLQAKGFEAVLSPVQVGNDTMYRVRVGPFDQRPQAEAVAARVRKELQVDTWITGVE